MALLSEVFGGLFLCISWELARSLFIAMGKTFMGIS